MMASMARRRRGEAFLVLGALFCRSGAAFISPCPARRLSSAASSTTGTETQPKDNRDDHLVSCVSGNREVVVKAITARSLVQDALIKQDLHPLACDALGRAMICTLLLSSGLKDQETLQLTFQGDGPLQGVMAISDGEGGVRGYVGNGGVELPYNPNGRPDVGAGIGNGLLKVVRNHPDYERPYSGIVKLRSGEVAYDVAAYLKDSEQKSCAIAAGVMVDGALVRQAGGWLIETLPDASEETEKIILRNLQRLINQAEDPSLLLGAGMTPTGLAGALLDGLGINSISMKTPSYKCHCSNERVYRALRLLPTEEMRNMVAANEVVEVKCEFCSAVYKLSPAEIVEELQLDV